MEFGILFREDFIRVVHTFKEKRGASMNTNQILVQPGSKVNLDKYDPAFIGKFTDKEKCEVKLRSDIEKLSEYQEILYADNRYALLIIVQAMDAAGKDSIIKHVMSGVNPQGCRISSFKQPSTEELRHDFLWRCVRELPPRGWIGIFNRSYYEEVLTVRVHPELLERQNLPASLRGSDIWKNRFEDINCFERYCVRNGIIILKYFLNVSREEQKKRLLERLDKKEKHWKFSGQDIVERKYWQQYRRAYEEVLSRTSTTWAPWYVIPADHKWFTRIAVADSIVGTLDRLHLSYPRLTKEESQRLQKTKKWLKEEG